MDLPADLDLIIYRATHIPRAYNQPDMRPQWARQRQARFNTIGLPRGFWKVPR